MKEVKDLSYKELISKFVYADIRVTHKDIENNAIYTELLAELHRRLKEGGKYRQFFKSCSCLFTEGMEFTTKTKIYEAIKREVVKLF